MRGVSGVQRVPSAREMAPLGAGYHSPAGLHLAQRRTVTLLMPAALETVEIPAVVVFGGVDASPTALALHSQHYMQPLRGASSIGRSCVPKNSA
jgi:hypothetical protein